MATTNHEDSMRFILYLLVAGAAGWLLRGYLLKNRRDGTVVKQKAVVVEEHVEDADVEEKN